MANHKSAIKRARQNIVRRERNRVVKTRVKTVTRDIRSAASEEAPEALAAKLARAQSVIDKAGKRGVIHKKAAARKKSRLARLINKAGA